MNELGVQKILWIKPGEGIAASGKIPSESEFFQDHFPGFAVLPGVLALEMLKHTAEAYLHEVNRMADQKYFLKQIRATKFHTYLKPGDEWESRLDLIAYDDTQSEWQAKLFHQGKVAVSAHLVLAPSHVHETKTADGNS